MVGLPRLSTWRHNTTSDDATRRASRRAGLLAACALGLIGLSCGTEATQVAVPEAATPEVALPTVPPTSTATPRPGTATPVAEKPTPTEQPAPTAGDSDESDEASEAALTGERDSRGSETPEAEPSAAAEATTTPPPTSEPDPTAEPVATAEVDDDVAADETRALVTTTGIVVPVLAGGPGGWWVFSPCAQVTLLEGTGATRITGTTVMIDPGHGGDETGAVGPTGIIEGDVNLDVANRLLDWLAERDIDAMTTRTGDYRIAIHSRGELAKAVQPDLFVSIHHNGGFPEPIDEPGTEVYFQHENPESKRLGGLLYEEIYDTIVSLDVQWYGNDHRGTQWRLNQEGIDLYGVLRRPAAAGVVAALTEATFMETEEEEALLTNPDFLQAEAEAIGRAIERWLTTADTPDDASARYNEGIVFQGTLGPGGGTDGCVDPPLE